jgi:AcrR family transcriptional regulator
VPKISDAHKQAQANRILDAAAHCFARDGFHATSMDSVIEEAGMSSSTVYRYFPGGKQELIRAVSARRIDPLVARIAEFAALDDPPDPVRAMTDAIALLAAPGADQASIRESAQLAVNAWAEMSRDPEVAEMIGGNYRTIRAKIVSLVRKWQSTGKVTNKLDADNVAAVIQNVAFGLVAEMAMLGESDIQKTALTLNVLLGKC